MIEILTNSNNRLFMLARKAQRLTPWWAVVLLTLVFMVGSAILINVLLAVLDPILPLATLIKNLRHSSNVLESALGQILLQTVQFAPALLLVWLWLKFYEKRPFWTLGLERAGALPKYLRGFLFGFLLFACTIGFMALTGSLSTAGGNPAETGLAALGGVVLVLLSWIVQSGTEEVVFRGWVLPTLGARYRPWSGVVASMILFAIAHFGALSNPIAIVNLMLVALLLCLYALYEGSIWGVCGLHTAWNWSEGNVFGLQVSGGRAEGGVLVSLKSTGADWITGGSFGPEAGIGASILLLVGIGVLLLLLRRRSQANIAR